MTGPPNIFPEKLPAWITRELVEETLYVWSQYYENSLTEREAIEILLDVGRLFDALGESDGEAIFSARESVEP